MKCVFAAEEEKEPEEASATTTAVPLADAALINVAVNAAEASAMGGADESELTGGRVLTCV